MNEYPMLNLFLPRDHTPKGTCTNYRPGDISFGDKIALKYHKIKQSQNSNSVQMVMFQSTMLSDVWSTVHGFTQLFCWAEHSTIHN